MQTIHYITSIIYVIINVYTIGVNIRLNRNNKELIAQHRRLMDEERKRFR